MTSPASSSTAFLYVEADVGQTLVEWRRERHAVRQAERTARRRLRLPFPRLARWAT